MRFPRRVIRFLVAVLPCVFLILGNRAQAAYSLGTGYGTGADEDVTEQSPADTGGGRAFLEMRSRNVSGTERHNIPFLRFDLTPVTSPLNAATLRFFIASSTTDSDSFSIDVYGVKDGVAGENNWSAASLCFNNAPGMAAGNYPNIDRNHVAANVVFLGTVNYPGGGYSGSLSFSNQALINFLNADTNHAATIFLEPQVAATGQEFFVHVRTIEGVGSQTSDFDPTLDLPNVTPPPTPTPPPADSVTLSENSAQVTITNSLVRAIFDKSNGECTDLRLTAGANLLLNGGSLYFDSNSGGVYYAFGGTYSVVENTWDRVHVKFTGRMGEFTAELHYVLQKNESGFRCYTVFRHGNGDAVTYLEQARMVLRCDPNVFTRAFTSEDKTGQMIAPSLLAAAPEIMDATLQLPASSSYTTPTGFTDTGLPVYTKYDWADFMETHKAHGLSSQTTGLWMLTGSEEFMNGGPTKAELFVHGTDTTPLMIETFHAAHFMGAAEANVPIAANEVWEKTFGPYFIYVNSGTTADALWANALQRADAEKTAWPPSWMNEAGFPLARGAVTGSLVAGGTPAAYALMVLAKPGSDWQTQGRDYIFWARADASGNFTIPKVRPGSYSLYACVPGVSGEMQLTNVNIAASATNDLGRITWTPPRRAQTLWQIGTPDRSAAEFRFGDRMRQFGLWWRYVEEKGTSDLNYTVGTSTASNWYYAQSVTPLDNNTYLSPKWNVLFSMASVPSGQSELVLDFAGQMSGTLNVTLNGTSIKALTLVNDAGIYRSTTRLARYRQTRVIFNSSLLRTGSNTLTFQLAGHSNWSGTKPTSPASGVMYDAIRLETGAATTEAIQRAYVVQVNAGAGGTATGGGTYAPGTAFEIRATPSAGYRFTQWSDGSTAAVRSMTAQSTASYTAAFALTPQGAYDQWAVSLPPGDHSFTGDANHDGVANGFEFAYGPLPSPSALLEMRAIDGKATAVLTTNPTPNGAAYTQLTVKATRTLSDWLSGAVTLQEMTVESQRAWTPTTTEKNVHFRADLKLNP